MAKKKAEEGAPEVTGAVEETTPEVVEPVVEEPTSVEVIEADPAVAEPVVAEPSVLVEPTEVSSETAEVIEEKPTLDTSGFIIGNDGNPVRRTAPRVVRPLSSRHLPPPHLPTLPFSDSETENRTHKWTFP